MKMFGPQERGTVGRFARGLWRRVVASVTIAVGGLLFVILYLGFWATRFPWYENVAVVLSTILLVPVLLVALWVAWAVGLARRAWRSGECHGETLA